MVVIARVSFPSLEGEGLEGFRDDRSVLLPNIVFERLLKANLFEEGEVDMSLRLIRFPSYP